MTEHEFFANLDLDERPRPKALYHYTDYRGLVGILHDRALWLSNAFYLNDSAELSYGIDLIRQIALERLNEEATTARRIALSAIPGWLEFAYRVNHWPFVACFSEDGDSLMAWRTYSKGGQGYALGLRDAGFKKSSLSTEPAVALSLRKVVYDTPRQQEIVGKLLDFALERADAIADAVSRKEQNATSDEAISLSMDVVTWLKHPSFYDEREWRLVAVAPAELRNDFLRFRDGGNRPIPYTVVTTDILPLAEVAFGPTLEPMLTESALRMMIWQYMPMFAGYIQTRASIIPMRI